MRPTTVLPRDVVAAAQRVAATSYGNLRGPKYQERKAAYDELRAALELLPATVAPTPADGHPYRQNAWGLWNVCAICAGRRYAHQTEGRPAGRQVLR